jgi:hypothetical protein
MSVVNTSVPVNSSDVYLSIIDFLLTEPLVQSFSVSLFDFVFSYMTDMFNVRYGLVSLGASFIVYWSTRTDFLVQDLRTHGASRSVSPMFETVYGFNVRQTGYVYGALR